MFSFEVVGLTSKVVATAVLPVEVGVGLSSFRFSEAFLAALMNPKSQYFC